MRLELIIDRDRCIGSGNCVYWLPAVFELDDQGYAIVVDPTAGSQDDIVTTAQRCPTRAISVEQDGHPLAEIPADDAAVGEDEPGVDAH